jgi:hypothetical protein
MHVWCAPYNVVRRDARHIMADGGVILFMRKRGPLTAPFLERGTFCGLRLVDCASVTVVM